MKKVLLAAALTMMAVPAFAQQPTAEEQPGVHNELIVTCRARNLAGFSFWGRGWNYRMAEMRALSSCRARTLLPFTCRVEGCRIGW